MEVEKLIELAFDVTKNAYIPYSKFAVGAVVLLKNGEIIQGCNIENAAYGSTMCAERNAIFTTYTKGYRKDDIVSLTIVADCHPLISPCGACRQVISELLHSNTPIILASKESYRITNSEELLPYSFTGEAL